jgi:glycosyltransferase involved in cell wall biosynthesis
MVDQVLLLRTENAPADAVARDTVRRGAQGAGWRLIEVVVGRGCRGLRSLGTTLGRRPGRVVTIGHGWRQHAAGWYLSRQGVPWIVVVTEDPPLRASNRWRRSFDPRLRVLRRARVVLTDTEAIGDRLHRELGLAVGPLANGKILRAQLANARPSHEDSLRVIMLGTLNAPHLEHLAIGLRDRGVDVVAGGDLTPAYPRSILPDTGVPMTVQTLPAIPWLRRLMREHRPHLVHAHWLYGHALLATVAGARPLVAMAWGSDVFGAPPLALLADRFVLRRADIAMSDSTALLDRLVDLGARPDRRFLLNWGVDLNLFTPGDRSNARRMLGLRDVPTILSPRGLRGLYNPRTIVEAFRQLTKDVDAQLVLKHIDSEAPDLGPLPEGVRLVGHVPYERMADFYRAADVTVSLPSSDSSPRSVWEAMACGSPTLISDLPWVHELIRDGSHALVVPVDAGRVADAMHRLVTDAPLAAEIAANARALVERERNRDLELDRLIELYEQLARRPA